MNKLEISIEWLKLRAEQEMLNISSKKISMLVSLFTPKKKLDENEISAAKSLAKIEMIHEIIQKSSNKI